ncbi:MAG: ACT domain-containing protein [Desulfobacterales bacterium]|nr:ACT domain-containing protein [Desulfobacterales bacterium]
MRIKQISIFLENKPGRLAEVTEILSEGGINIRALSVADTSDFGVLRLIVDDSDKAETIMKNNGFTVRKTDVVAVGVSDRPGGLHAILDMLLKAGVNVEYLYAFVHPAGGKAVMIFRFDKIDEAVGKLRENGFKLFDGPEIYGI